MLKKLKPIDCLPFYANRLIRDEDVTELADDIRKNGQLVPIIAAPHPTNPGKFEIAGGNRRTRACLLLDIDVLADVQDKPFAPGEAIQKSVSENLKRKNPDVFEICEMVSAFKREMKIQTWAQVAEELGLSPPTMSRILGVKRIPDSLKPLTEGLGGTVIQMIGKEPSIDAMAKGFEFASTPDEKGNLPSKERVALFLKQQKEGKKRGRKASVLKGKFEGRQFQLSLSEKDSPAFLAEWLKSLSAKVAKSGAELPLEGLPFIFQ